MTKSSRDSVLIFVVVVFILLVSSAFYCKIDAEKRDAFKEVALEVIEDFKGREDVEVWFANGKLNLKFNYGKTNPIYVFTSDTFYQLYE